MVSQCANPKCSKPLLRMKGGRLYGFPNNEKGIEHFWLCVECARRFTLIFKEGKVELVKKTRSIA